MVYFVLPACCKAEISKLDVLEFIKKDVLWFDVSVKQFSIGQISKCLHELKQEFFKNVLGNFSFLGKISQTSTFSVFIDASNNILNFLASCQFNSSFCSCEHLFDDIRVFKLLVDRNFLSYQLAVFG